jgi:hypothetical protein
VTFLLILFGSTVIWCSDLRLKFVITDVDDMHEPDLIMNVVTAEIQLYASMGLMSTCVFVVLSCSHLFSMDVCMFTIFIFVHRHSICL